MGHGAARPDFEEKGEMVDLGPELADRLEEALCKLDRIDPSFKQSREDERAQQLSKAWSLRAVEIVENLRAIGQVIVGSHQILTDMSQDGAGITASPWVEDGSLRLERLYIRNHNGPVRAEVGHQPILEAKTMEDVDYAWLERAVVEWIIYAVDHKK